MEKYLINVVGEYVFFGYRQHCFEDLFKRKNIKTIVFCQIGEKKEVKEKGYEIRKYKDFEDLKRQLFEIGKQKIFYINTFDEKLILEVNILKKELGFAFTEKFEIFRNKDLQRKYLFEKFPETTVRFQEIDLEKNEKIIIDFPCMIKPTSSAQSSGVAFLKDFEDFLKYKKNYKNLKKSLKDRGYEKNKFILEEFIDGE
ncbi:ATP-grasp domain-containing protein, partial [Candidatus Gracilibacteria bacterium]|nr:ATP-grasp domain-containing protein [Candidatus Gracilibacteria bacterium]